MNALLNSSPWQIEGVNSMLEHRVFNAAGEYVGAFARKRDAELAIAAPKLAEALRELIAAHDELPGSVRWQAADDAARAALAEAGIE